MHSNTPEFKKVSGVDPARSSGGEAQAAFNEKYASTIYIREVTGVTTPAVHAAVRTGRIPAPTVRVPGANVWLWERTPNFLAALTSWVAEIQDRERRRAGAV